MRIADSGTIGVHRSSFSGGDISDVQVAVSAVQQMTAEIITYMIEMGIDPAMLQIALQYDSDDMRYLSRSEMELYNIVMSTPERDEPKPSEPPRDLLATPQPEKASKPSVATLEDDNVLFIPLARTGRVRHPGGDAPLKSEPDSDSASLSRLNNGTSISIEEQLEGWYQVQAGRQTGFMHHSWILVDEYMGAYSEQRYIQIRSYHELNDALEFVRTAPVPLSAFLSTNGWIAVAFRETYDRDTALRLLKVYKAKRAVPKDSFVTYGNTYVRKVCCD